eukprot:1379131-Amorphochlora_amoeboformis.AAC.1
MSFGSGPMPGYCVVKRLLNLLSNFSKFFSVNTEQYLSFSLIVFAAVTAAQSIPNPPTPSLTIPPTPPPGDITIPPTPPPGDITLPPTPPPGDITLPPTPPPGDITLPPTPPPNEITVPPVPPTPGKSQKTRS